MLDGMPDQAIADAQAGGHAAPPAVAAASPDPTERLDLLLRDLRTTTSGLSRREASSSAAADADGRASWPGS